MYYCDTKHCLEGLHKNEWKIILLAAASVQHYQQLIKVHKTNRNVNMYCIYDIHKQLTYLFNSFFFLIDGIKGKTKTKKEENEKKNYANR